MIAWILVAILVFCICGLLFGWGRKPLDRRSSGPAPGECTTCGFALWTLGEGITHCPACNSVV
jgi:hypothetical protein